MSSGLGAHYPPLPHPRPCLRSHPIAMTDAEHAAGASSASPGPARTVSSVDSLKKGAVSPTDDATQNVLLHNEKGSIDGDADADADADDTEDDRAAHTRPGRTATLLYAAAALVILGWWVSGLVVPQARHRWLVQTLWTWFFVLVIAFRFLSARPIATAVASLVAAPFARTPPRARLALLWLAALAITFGTAFAAPRPAGTRVTDRVISLAGVYFAQLVIVANSIGRSRIDWPRIPAGIILQQALALFVLKSDAGFQIARWFSTAVADFQTGAIEVTALVFDADVAEKNWFFVSGLAVFVFFAAWVQMLYFFGWMQWLTKQFAWFGSRVLGCSGAEAFVAIWTPWFGQVNSAILVGPYIASMTDSEIFSVMATSMASISSLMIRQYSSPALGANARLLLTQSAVLIPGAIINAKVAFPERENEKDAVVTRSRASVAKASRTRKLLRLTPAHDTLEALCDGSWLGLRVAGGVLANFFMLLALLAFINGFCIWTFRAFAIHSLDLHTIAAAPLAPFVFFLGVPRNEVWRVSYVLAQRLLNGTDLGFAALAKVQAGAFGTGDQKGARGAFSARGWSVMLGALANEASLPSLGVQMGVMTALAGERKGVVGRAVLPALVIATLSSFQAACVTASML